VVPLLWIAESNVVVPDNEKGLLLVVDDDVVALLILPVLVGPPNGLPVPNAPVEVVLLLGPSSASSDNPTS